MPSTFLLAPSPKWYFHDDMGALAANGTLETWSSTNKTVPKAVFSDPAGTFPIINPIILDGTGGTPVPIYWEEDGVDKYYIVVKDADGNIIFTLDNYPISGGGGGTPVTQLVDIENQIINGQFHIVNEEIFNGLPNTGSLLDLSINPVPVGFIPIAPGAGSIGESSTGGYVAGSQVDTSGKSIGGGTLGGLDHTPGWLFIKQGGASLNDTIVFGRPDPGVGFPNGPSANAPRYFQYSSTNSFAATELDLTFVIADVRAFSGETIQVSWDVWCSGVAPNGEFIIEQDFGTGGTPTAPNLTATAINFPNAKWEKRSLTLVVPDISAIPGVTIGSNQNDVLRLRWRIPSNNILTYRFTNMQVTLGATVITDFIYKNYNETASKLVMELIAGLLPKTGDTKLSIRATHTTGWIVIQNDTTTLGNASSLATYFGEYTRNLYRLIWDSFNDTLAPVSTGRGGDADSDFDANKTITFPNIAGRVLGVLGQGTGLTLRTLGELRGDETVTLSLAQIPPHNHTPATYFAPDTVSPIDRSGPLASLPAIDTPIPTEGGGQPHQNMQPTTFLYLHVKL